jgi:hypothetical protein
LQARNRSPDIEIIDILDDDSSESVSSGPQGNLENSTLPKTQTAQIPECASPMEKSKSREMPLDIKGDKRAALGSDSHEEEQRSSPVYPPSSEKSSPVMESSFVFPRIETLSPVILQAQKSSPVEESSSGFSRKEICSPVFPLAEKSSPVEETSSGFPRKETSSPVLPTGEESSSALARKATSSPVFPRAGESSPVPSPVDVQEAESELLRCKECGSGQDDIRGLATHAFQHSFQLGARLMRGNNIVSSID